MSSLKLLAMLSKQPPIEGDDALLRLAQVRLAAAGLGGELYPGSVEHLRHLLAYLPEGLACTAHLPRHISLLEESGRSALMAFAAAAPGRLYGLIVHDQREFSEHPEATIAALQRIDRSLAGIREVPQVFLEYASGLDPEFFVGLFERINGSRHLCAAVDVGHVGIHICQVSYRNRFRGQDVCSLGPDSPDLAAKLEAVEESTREALPGVLSMIERLVRWEKPVHFHLHDGHPLSTLSRFGVSDHLSFLQQIELPFSYRGSHLLSGMFGISGLRRIIHAARDHGRPDRLSFMLEIHPQEGRTPLAKRASLFRHWDDTCNAEKMNFWLDRLLENAALVRDAWAERPAESAD